MRKLAVIMLLLVAGCSFFSTPKQAADILGTDGLKITLPKLPTELYQGQGLDIPITLENVGTHKVENGILSISGYDANFTKFRTLPKIEGINLDGRSNFVPIGEKTTKVFTISSIDLHGLKEKKETFEAVACYQYSTDASPVVCINPKLAFGQNAVTSGCNFIDAQLSTSQGAPIAVTKVETWYFSDKQEVEFRIFVKNVGSGVVLENSAYGKRCLGTAPLTADDLNTINMEAFMSGQKLNCQSTSDEVSVDKFKIVQEGPSMRCRAQVDFNEPGFTTPLTLKITYGYVNLDVFSLNLKSSSVR